jgi:putative peptidoglycan lipid II flippase
MGFLALGDVMTAALYQTGKFDRTAVNYVWGIVAGSAVGLLASTLGRLYSSTYYALHDTRTPLVFAVVRVILTTVLGYLCSIPLPHLLGIETRWGAVGLTASAGVAGWVEFYLLRQALNKRIGRTGLAKSYVLKLWTSAAIAAGVGWGLKFVVGHLHPIPFAAVVLGGYGFTYFGVSYALGLPEAATLIGQFTRRLGFGKR